MKTIRIPTDYISKVLRLQGGVQITGSLYSQGEVTLFVEGYPEGSMTEAINRVKERIETYRGGK